jgi:protein disulfide-isomerase-like protein
MPRPGVPARWVLALAVLFASAVVRGDASEDVDDPDVLVLDTGNFDATIEKYSHTLVEFYAPWCGHCKQLAPAWARAATTLKTEAPGVAVAKVDADKERELGERFGVQGFPTIKWFVGGGSLPLSPQPRPLPSPPSVCLPFPFVSSCLRPSFFSHCLRSVP